MINSFWNICRSCPMPTEEKYNSEYSRNYTWHQTAPSQDVVKRAPEITATSMEPCLPRKKKYPEVAYRSNEFLKFSYSDKSSKIENIGTFVPTDFRARSEERSSSKPRTNQRSRSADPNLGRKKKNEVHIMENPTAQSEYKLQYAWKADKDPKVLMVQSYPPAPRQKGEGQVESSVVKTTEYRSQFAWPAQVGDSSQASARKSVSMGAIAAEKESAGRYRKVKHIDQVDSISVTKPESKQEDRPVDAKAEFQPAGKMKRTEYKAKYKPFSSYLYVEGNWKKVKHVKKETPQETEPNSWYSEVVERIKKADEYKARAYSSLIYGDSDKVSVKPSDLWTREKDHRAFAALSLAATSRSTSRDEKLSRESSRDRPHTAPIHRSISKKDKKDSDTKSEPISRPVSADRTKEKHARSFSPDKKRREAKGRPKSAEPSTAEKYSPTYPPKAIYRGSSTEESSTKSDDRKPKHVTKSRTPSKESPQALSPQSKPRAVTRPSVQPAPANAAEKVSQKTAEPKEKPALKTEEVPKPPAKLNGVAPPEIVPGKKSPIGDGDKKDAVRPNSLPSVNGVDVSGSISERKSLTSPPIPIHSGPVPLTNVRSPEEVTGIKSPDPESWTVPLETNKGLEWTDGHTPIEPARVKSPPMIITGKGADPVQQEVIKETESIESSGCKL